MLKKKKIRFDENWLIIAGPGEEASEAAAGKILALPSLPDGLFAGNDMAAAVCMRVFQERGLRVPQDIAVVGFGDEVIGKVIRPALTTIHYPAKEMGERAARAVVDHLQNKGDVGRISTMSMRADLVVRQSSRRGG
jgi:LacI family transcriptional regulator